jgi:hypothetical protein
MVALIDRHSTRTLAVKYVERGEAVMRKKKVNGHVITIIGFLVIALGSWVAFYGQVVLRKKDAEANRQSIERDNLAIHEKLQTVMSALGSAKMEESKRLTDERIKLIQGDLLTWATEFVQSRPERKKAVDAARLAAQQKEIQISERVRPIYAFVLRFIQETLAVYETKTTDNVKASLFEPPDNLYLIDPHAGSRIITFRGGAKWEIYFQTEKPAREDIPPAMKIHFTNGTSGGNARFRVLLTQNKLTIDLDGSLPDPRPYKGFVESDLSEYQNTISVLLRTQLESQLILSGE